VKFDVTSAVDAVEQFDFHEDRPTEGHTILMVVNELTFYACTVKQHDVLKVKNNMVDSALRHRV
jgi:hypothetical protein